MKKKYGDKIYIEWFDACTADGWENYNEAMKIPSNAFCRTNALYIGETKEFLIVSHTQGKTKENALMGRLLIPKKWIKKIK